MSILGLGSCTFSFALPSKQLLLFKGLRTSESLRLLSYQTAPGTKNVRGATCSSADTLHLERNSKLRQVKPALNRAMPLFVFLCLMSDYLFPGSTFVKGNVFHFSATFQWCGQRGLCFGWAKYEACWEPHDQFGRACCFSGMFKKGSPFAFLKHGYSMLKN